MKILIFKLTAEDCGGRGEETPGETTLIQANRVGYLLTTKPQYQLDTTKTTIDAVSTERALRLLVWKRGHVHGTLKTDSDRRVGVEGGSVSLLSVRIEFFPLLFGISCGIWHSP
jgi:hypothetical protein